jgi:hypothetical protein
VFAWAWRPMNPPFFLYRFVSFVQLGLQASSSGPQIANPYARNSFNVENQVPTHVITNQIPLAAGNCQNCPLLPYSHTSAEQLMPGASLVRTI